MNHFRYSFLIGTNSFLIGTHFLIIELRIFRNNIFFNHFYLGPTNISIHVHVSKYKRYKELKFTYLFQLNKHVINTKMMSGTFTFTFTLWSLPRFIIGSGNGSGYLESLFSTQLHATCPFVLRQKINEQKSASQGFLQFHGTKHMISLLFKSKKNSCTYNKKEISSTLSLTHFLHSPL